ncbi:SPOR domain-containing protein [Tsuneonella sp. HG249]
MPIRVWKTGLFCAVALSGVVGLASAAQADVKAGVDAWSKGDFSQAVAEWREPADRGDPDALFNLAQAYRLGRGVATDLARAETLYQSAAALGHLKAADNYGILMFQSGRRAQAMPYVIDAAGRGDPRAQYLLGIAHFNGDLAAKDWPRAYALLTLANGAGLPQAGPALKQMDGFVPLAEREQAQLLAAELRANADASRSVRLAAIDLGSPPVGPVPPLARVDSTPILATVRAPEPIANIAVDPSIVEAEAAVAEAMRASGMGRPATAGADRPGTRPATTLADAVTAPTAQPAVPIASSSGPWKIQLGAFAVPGNVDKAWALASAKSPLAGKEKQTIAAGRITRLLAVGWPSQSAAQAACRSLKSAGQSCLVTR